MPSHRAAIVESLANVATGALINITLCQWLIFPLLGVPVRLDQNIALTLALTVVALLRNYAVRRCFVAMAMRRSVLKLVLDRPDLAPPDLSRPALARTHRDRFRKLRW